MDVPIYQSARTAPSRKGPRVSTQRNPAFDIIQYRAQQRLGEIDTAKAIDAFNAFRDEGRAELNNQLSKQGEDAVGIAESHKSWLDKRMGVYDKERLAGFSQKEQFNRMASQYRAGNLNRLARHEAVEHQNWMAQTAKNLLTGSMDEAAQNPDITEQLIGVYEYKIDGLFPGIDKSAEKMAGAAGIRVAAIEAAIRDNPVKAIELIDKWQDVEGMNAYDLTALRNRAENAVEKNITTGAYWKLKTMFPNDPESAVDYLDNEDNSKAIGIETVQQQQYLVNLFEAEQVQKDNKEKEDTITARDNEADLIAEALRRNDMKTAMDTIENSTVLTEVEKLEYESNFATAKKTVTDTILKSEIYLKIAKNEITHKAQYMMYQDQGLTAQDIQELDQALSYYKNEPDQKFYAQQAVDLFKLKFNDTDWENYQPEFEVWLHKAIPEEGLKGDAIFKRAVEYMGNIEDPWFGGPRLESEFGKNVKSIEENIGKKTEKPKPEKARFKVIGEEGRAIPANVAAIPEEDMKEIVTFLQENNKALSEPNIMYLFEKSKTNAP